MSLLKAKKITSDPLNKNDEYSKNLIQLSNDIKNFISIDNILRFRNKSDYLIPKTSSPQDYLFIMIDTETTGLQSDNKLDVYTDAEGKKNEYISYRNQIVEVGAVAYNWNLNFETQTEKTFFHGKIKDIALNEYNSIYKIEMGLISKFNELYLSNKDIITEAFTIAQGKAKYNPEYSVFRRNFPSIFDSLDEFNRETLIKHIFKYNLLIAINEMNQSGKEYFKYPYDETKGYKVNNNYRDELHLIESLFSFIESKKNLYYNVIIGAHNLPYDEGMIRGAITSAIDHYTYIEEDQSLKNYYMNLLERHKNIFSDKLNTTDIFKDILNFKKYGARLISLYHQKPEFKKIKMLRHLTKSLSKKRYSSGSFSVSLGNLAPISLNKDFHTTINDIHVTIETLKLYFSIPIIIDYNDKIKISEKIKGLIEKI
jgi:hypothetical protein